MNQPPTSIDAAAIEAALAEAEAIKVEMTRLLAELEAKVTGETPDKPGKWRHHPTEWAAAHPAPAESPSTKLS